MKSKFLITKADLGVWFIAIISAWLFFSAGDDPDYELNPKKGSNIVFIGNTFAEQLQNHNYFEALLYQSFPDRNLTIRNLGWSADEVDLRPRPLNFGSIFDHIKKEKADYVFAFYGLNEAFNGKDSLDTFKKNLSDYLRNIKEQKFNGTSNPELILVSPIAHEEMGGLLPDPKSHNNNLELYTEAMRKVSGEMDIPFIDLFEPVYQLMQNKSEKLTYNGIHLTDNGYKQVSKIMAGKLGFPVQSVENDKNFDKFREVIKIKNQQYFYKYRAVNGEYIYGRRNKPYGVKSFPPERKKIEQMVIKLDSLIWDASHEGTSIEMNSVKNIVDYTDQYIPVRTVDDSIEELHTDNTLENPSTAPFVVKDGYNIELFASEQEFPIGNPTSLTFDPKGRLWVSTIQSFPQKLPGSLPNDKLVVLEDTDDDGKADKHTVFADSLYEPLGFEIGDGGIYISQPPDLVFLKDTTGDLRADTQEPLLHGFGTEDIHHAIGAYEWGPDGALYFEEGTFLHSQIETPYGPVRSAYGTTWRYEPYTEKLTRYISYPYSNPWGNVFTKSGVHLIGDASPGRSYYATPITTAIDYPYKHMWMDDFPTTRLRVIDGTEIMSSRHFPESVQGNYLETNMVGFEGVKQYELSDIGSGIIGHETEPILESKDSNFVAADVQIGPDGALYLLDFANPIIGHMTYSFRDPNRDHTHGRIWRVTYEGEDTLEPTDLTQLDIPDLLDQLKVYENRVRYRTRIQLREFPKEEVLRELSDWVKNLDPNSKEYDQYRLEALWVSQQFHQVNKELLRKLLNSSDKDIRAAATRVLYYSKDAISNAQQMLVDMVGDSSQRVRLEAIVGLSHIENEASVNALLDAMDQPIDYYLYYALNESFKHLRPVWMKMFEEDRQFLKDEPKKAFYVLSSVTSEKSLAIPAFIEQDPESPKYKIEPFNEEDYQNLSEVPAVVKFRIAQPGIGDATKLQGLRFLSEIESKSEEEIITGRMDFLSSLKNEFDLILNWKISKSSKGEDEKQENEQLVKHLNELSELLEIIEGSEQKQDLASGDGEVSASVEKGKTIAQNNACFTCHTTDGTEMAGPTWQNLFGHEVKLESGETVQVDEEYLRESIVNPEAKSVAGYAGEMPKYDYLSSSDIDLIIEYIKSLSD